MKASILKKPFEIAIEEIRTPVSKPDELLIQVKASAIWKKDAMDIAKKRMEEILATHKPTPLAVDQEKEIDRILKEAKRYFKKKGLC